MPESVIADSFHIRLIVSLQRPRCTPW